MDTRNNTPGAEYEKPHDDPQRQLGLPFPKLDSSIPLDSPIGSPAGSPGRLTVVFYSYPTIGYHAGESDLSEEIIYVQKFQVLLANHLGLSVADLLEQLCAKSGFEVLHVRESERAEFEVSVDIEVLRRSHTFREKFDKRKS